MSDNFSEVCLSSHMQFYILCIYLGDDVELCIIQTCYSFYQSLHHMKPKSEEIDD